MAFRDVACFVRKYLHAPDLFVILIIVRQALLADASFFYLMPSAADSNQTKCTFTIWKEDLSLIGRLKFLHGVPGTRLERKLIEVGISITLAGDLHQKWRIFGTQKKNTYELAPCTFLENSLDAVGRFGTEKPGDRMLSNSVSGPRGNGQKWTISLVLCSGCSGKPSLIDKKDEKEARYSRERPGLYGNENLMATPRTLSID